MGHDVPFIFFFGVHANCPNFVPFKSKKERERERGRERERKRTKKDNRIYQIKKRRKQKRNERRG